MNTDPIDKTNFAPAIAQQIAAELGVAQSQVNATVELLDSGATVPFIARYRKEVTGNLDDIQLRLLHERLAYLRELFERRVAVLKSIAEQGKLTPELQAAIAAVSTKQALEDLYLPYKPKRRTKGQMAKEAGIEPLADALFADPRLDPLAEAAKFVQPAGTPEGTDFSTAQAVVDGARDILSERWAEDAVLVQNLREWLWTEAQFESKLASGKNENDAEIAKFRDYFDYQEPLNRVPSHRALAVFRARTLGHLDAGLVVPVADASNSKAPSLAEGRIALHLGWSHQNRAADDWLRKVVAWTWRVKLSLSTERELFTRLREAAEKTAIDVFASNLRDLLLAAPAGPRVVMGLDPGIRTGVKVAVVDATGKLVDTATVYPHEPRRDWQGSLQTLGALCVKHRVNLIAIGNGTASRETDQLAGELMGLLAKLAGASAAQSALNPETTGTPKITPLQKVVVSEAGASVYSASEYASQEMPDVDVSLRGAASIARRLQDPLAELVKIDPKSIGVGQYQHDVNQSELARSLEAVVEDCVNAVGVDLNTASVPLLSHVSGLSPSVAKAVVRWREAQGAFANRQQLLKVTGLGPKAFEQCAGFLRIRGGDNPLDMTGVHPESYSVVEHMLTQLNKPIGEVMGRSELLKTLKPASLVNERFGLITVKDIVQELEKPGRDPRPEFVVAKLNDSVQDIADLREDMVLEGTVTNVAAFGAFVDIGVHQDGLVHISQLSSTFVKDPHTIVKAGQVVKVRVVEVDAPRKRIALTMRLDTPLAGAGKSGASSSPRDANGSAMRKQGSYQDKSPVTGNSKMASAFAKLQGLR
jgi:protein Tex